MIIKPCVIRYQPSVKPVPMFPVQSTGDHHHSVPLHVLPTVIMITVGPFALTVVVILNAVVSVKLQIALKVVFVMLVTFGMDCNVSDENHADVLMGIFHIVSGKHFIKRTVPRNANA